MVDAIIVLSLAYAASQEALVDPAQRVVVTHARALREAAIQHCLEYLGSKHPDLELEGSARSMVHFKRVLPEAACGLLALCRWALGSLTPSVRNIT